MMNKNASKVLKPIYVIIILASIILLAGFAWSRYMTSLNGTATAPIAKFSVKINGQTNEGFVIDFAQTKTGAQEIDMSADYIGPGTSGAFTIDVDAEDSDVALEYYLSIDFTDKPTNLLLYSDSGYNNLIYLPVSDKKVVIDTIPVIENNVPVPKTEKHRTLTIYWKWKYETGETAEQIEANDYIDSKYMGKVMNVPIQIKAVQKNPNQQENYFEMSFADMVHVGDVVNYNPENLQEGKTIENDCTYKAEGTITPAQIAEQTGTGYSENQIFSLNDDDCKITTWRVLGINDSGEVELMGITQKNLILKGQAGYINGINIMNKISEIYGNGKGATRARSMTEKDINRHTIYDKTTYISLWNYAYGTKKTMLFFNYESFTEMHQNVKFYVTSAEDSEGNTVVQEITKDDMKEVPQTYYQYEISSNKKSGIPNSIYDMLIEKNYWLASDCLFFHQNGAATNIALRAVISGFVDGYAVFTSVGRSYERSSCVAPIVTLKSDIQAEETSQGSGVWNLVLE